MTAVRAAVEIAREHGIRVDAPRVLYERQAVVVHLAPAPLVARVGVEDVFGPRLEWQRGAIPFVEHLAAAGASVVPPSDLLPPGPYVRESLVLSFWRYVDEEHNRPLDAARAGEALGEIHELGLTYHGELTPFWVPGELHALLARAEVERALGPQLELVLDAADGIRARLPGRPQRPLHGDAHIWNTLRTAAGPLWLDFDEACRGPLEWDAATMIEPDWVQRPRREVGEAYAAAFGDRFSEQELAPWVELRALMIVVWLAVHADRTPGVRRELEHVLAWLRPRLS